MLKTQITNPQREYIKVIEETLGYFDVKFEGTTRGEASAFLNKYIPYYRDVLRLKKGLLPYWTQLGNKPSHFTVIPEIMNFILVSAEAIERSYYPEMPFFEDHSWGDEW